MHINRFGVEPTSDGGSHLPTGRPWVARNRLPLPMAGADDPTLQRPRPQGGTIVARHVSPGRHVRILPSPAQRDGTMPHTYTSILFHLVFSTQGRVFAISEPPSLWAYVAGVAKNQHYRPYAIGGTGNHIHVLAGAPAMVSAAEAVQKLKANSSRWLRENGKWPGWQEGSAASPSALRTLTPFATTFKTRKNIIGGKRTKRSFCHSWNDRVRHFTNADGFD